MGRSFYTPTPANTTGIGKKAVSFYHKASDSYFTVFERDGRFYEGRHQIGFGGRETNIEEKQIDYVVGSGDHARTYLSRTSRNTLVELPLGWYAENGGTWAMNPGYDRPDHPGFTRNVTYACMFCHNAVPAIPAQKKESSSEPIFPSHIPEGIDCQRCHGPGSRHVEAAQTAGTAREAIRKTIVNPARLSAERQLEVCMQCHLETASSGLPNAIVRYERAPFSYVPGEPLGDFALHFDEAPGAGNSDRFQIVNAAYRLRQSTCFRESAGALRCTTCHDPHSTLSGVESDRHYTQVCRECHAAPFDQLVNSGKHPRSDSCVECHMPKRRTEDVVHVVMTDHYIQRRKPSRDLLAHLEERSGVEDKAYRGEVVLYYPPDLPKGPARDLYVAIAQVGQKNNLAQGTIQLARAIDKYQPESIEYALQLADAWIDSGQFEKAIPLQEGALRREPNSVVAMQKLATSLGKTGDYARSTELLKRALNISPSDAPGWQELGLNYVALGARSDAVAAFRKAVSLNPDLYESWNSLGGVWLESGDLPQAESAFREAIRIQPDYAEAHSNLGNALSAAGNFPEAQYHFEIAVRYKPGYGAGRFNYALALARVRRFDEAQQQAAAALKSDPANAAAHDLLGNLLLAKGGLGPAIEHYREALRIQPGFGRAQLDLGEALADSGDVAGALPYLQQAAGSPEQGVREEALQTLRELARNR
jgi:predicted CXXCH cytochrome family protein